MDREAWQATVHGVAKSWTQLSDFTFTFHFHALEKEMATHSGVLAWRIPGMGEPGGLPSLGLHRVGHRLKRLSSSSMYGCESWTIKKAEMKLLSLLRLFAIPRAVFLQAPSSMEFSRQEYWSALPFPSPGNLPNPGIEPRSPALQADSLLSEPPGKPQN